MLRNDIKFLCWGEMKYGKQIGRKEPPLFEVDGKAVLTGLTKGDKLGAMPYLQ